jgi:hypothetical protein
LHYPKLRFSIDLKGQVLIPTAISLQPGNRGGQVSGKLAGHQQGNAGAKVICIAADVLDGRGAFIGDCWQQDVFSD